MCSAPACPGHLGDLSRGDSRTSRLVVHLYHRGRFRIYKSLFGDDAGLLNIGDQELQLLRGSKIANAHMLPQDTTVAMSSSSHQPMSRHRTTSTSSAGRSSRKGKAVAEPPKDFTSPTPLMKYFEPCSATASMLLYGRKFWVYA